MRAVRTVEVAVPPERLLAVILDFPSYPAFLPEIRRAVVVRQAGPGRESEWAVAFHAEVVRTMSYTLRLWRAPDPPDGVIVVQWSLIEGSLFKANEGNWTLRPLDGPVPSTLATYEIMVELGVFVPTSLVATLTGSSLPATLAAFKGRAEGAAGGALKSG